MGDNLKAIRLYNIRKRPLPRSSALLVIDMQVYFKPLALPIIENLGALIQVWRQCGLPLVFTRHGHKDPASDGGMLDRWWGSLIHYGSADWPIIEELEPQPEEPIIDKATYSGFEGTALDKLLKSKGVTDILISGVMTNLCCETTARHAFIKNYHVHFLSDGTSTADPDLHLATLKNLAFGFAHIISCGQAADMAAACAGAKK
jgi:nicotinamidase-related amidase